MASHEVATTGSVPADTLPAALLRDSGARFSLATAVLVVTLSAAGLVGASPAQATACALAAAGLTTIGLTMRWCLAIALVAWALVTGFFYHQFGELTFDRSDLLRLVLLLVAVSALSVLTAPLASRSSPSPAPR